MAILGAGAFFGPTGMAVTIVGGAIYKVVSHSNHSNYGDHSNYSEHSDYSDYSAHSKYGDAAVISEIQSKRDRYRNQKIAADDIQRKIREEFQDGIEMLRGKSGAENYKVLADAQNSPEYYINDFDLIKRRLQEDMTKQLEKEIADDQERLKEIDSLLARINEIELQGDRR